jgi:hypothetical protein
MIATYPQVPTGYELGINVAVESYDGKLFFGLIADAQAAPDVNRLRDFLYVSFQELSRAARKAGAVRLPALPKKNRRRKEDVAERRCLASPQLLKVPEAAAPSPGMGSTRETTSPASPAAPAAEATSAA